MKRKNSAYTENLIIPIVEASLSTNWEEAVLEWDICDCQEDETAQTDCMCGHEGIRYLFYIRNRHNDRTFGPIGSECIKKFGRKDLSSEVDVQERMFRLYDAIRKREFIELNSDFFSRKLLLYLFEQNARTRATTSSCSICSTSATRTASPTVSSGRSTPLSDSR